MRKIKFLLVLIFSALSVLLYSGSAKAADSDVVINEVMANPLGADSGHEWIEMANFGNDLDLKNWQVKIYNDPAASSLTKTIIFNNDVILSANNYLIILNNAETYKPCSACATFSAGTFTITNSKGKIELIDEAGSLVHEFVWQSDQIVEEGK